MKIRSLVLLVLSGIFVVCQCAVAAEPIPAEHSEADNWVAAKFEGKLQPSPDSGYLLPELKSGSLEKNARRGHILQIADKSFSSGIQCPSVGTIRVHLPAPARKLTAMVGVDSNDITYYSSLGRGKVTVSLEVDGKDIFRSPVMREGLAALPVDVELGGAQDFTLRIGGENAGTEWDQADFADAKVILSGRKRT